MAVAGSKVTITDWTASTANADFNRIVGEFTVPEHGAYLFAVGADGGPTAAAAVSSSPSDGPYELAIERNGTPIAERPFPMLDVDVALVLTLRTPLRHASAQLTRIVDLEAGDVVTVAIEPNGLSYTAEFDADLTIARVPS